MAGNVEDHGGEAQRPELARLPHGRHGLPREFVIHNQRERLIDGLAKAVAEDGYAGATISTITKQANVSRRTFYEHFANKDECFLAAYDAVMERLRERVGAAVEGSGDWPEGVRAGIGAMLGFLAAEPQLARLCMVEAQVAGPEVVERYDEAIRSFVPLLRLGPAEFAAAGGGEDPLSPTAEEALVGGIVSLISRRILAGRADQLGELAPELVEFALTPYLGSAEASRIAAG